MSFMRFTMFARLLGAVVVLLLQAPLAAPGWSGEASFVNMTRQEIQARADLMIDSTWTPKNNFINFQYGSTYLQYNKGTTYKGVAYSQNNPQETWTEFSNLVNNTSGGNQGYGNDCSGFVSICWKLTGRKTTYYFEAELGTYWTSLGNIGSAASAPLRLGDALNSSGDGHIVLFLNFESSGVRTMEQTPNNAQRKVRSFSNVSNYRPIRRKQVVDGPSLTRDGLSKVVDTGNPVSLSVTATGNAPLGYRWQFNGTEMPGATANALYFPTAQPVHAGNYVCIVTNLQGSVTSRVMTLTVYPRQTTVFLDTFDTDTSAQWRLNRSSADTRVRFAHDYSGMGIPSAPRSSGGTTRGLKMEANMTAGATAAVSLSPLNRSFNGDCRLRFDLWINANGPFPLGGNGSSQHATAGIGTAGNRTQWTGSGSTADGYWFAVDGEGQAGDTSSTVGDFCAYSGASLLVPSSGVYAAGTAATAKADADPYYQAAFPVGRPAPAVQQANYPQQQGACAAGTIGFGWHEVIVSRRGNVVDWSIDGIRLATISNAVFTADNVFVGYWDMFTSLSDNTNLSFAVVDNVRVEVPVVVPAILAQPQHKSVFQGAPASFAVSATGMPTPTYQWCCYGVPLPAATNSTHNLPVAWPANAGNYTVIVSNDAGSITSAVATLTVRIPQPGRFESLSKLPDGKLQLNMSGETGGTYILECTSDFEHWSNACTLLGGSAMVWTIDPADPNFPRRFYRLRPGP